MRVNLVRCQFYELRCLDVSRCPRYTQLRFRRPLRLQHVQNVSANQEPPELRFVRYLLTLESPPRRAIQNVKSYNCRA